MAFSNARKGRGGSSRREFQFLGLSVVLLLAAVAGVAYTQRIEYLRGDMIDSLEVIDTRGREVGVLASDALMGDPKIFNRLKTIRADMQQALGSPSGGARGPALADVPSSLGPEVQEVLGTWKSVSGDMDQALTGQKEFASFLNSSAAAETAAAKLSAELENYAAFAANNGATASVSLLIAGQVIRAERVQRLAAAVHRSQSDLGDVAGRLVVESRALGRTLETFEMTIRGSASLADAAETQKSMSVIKDSYATIQSSVESMASDAEVLVKTAAGLRDLTKSGPDLALKVHQLSEGLSNDHSKRAIALMSWIAGGIALVLMLAFIVQSNIQLRRRQFDSEDRDARQQAAILALLDQITNLADGDLTVDVTVTEDFTGAIADSINYTIDTLRSLVGTITDTSVEIAAAATSTQDTAQKMSQASERQAREISAVTQTISQTSQSLTQVAGRAEELAKEAATSVDVAHNGAETVGRTIQSMATLRQQIQDTAKRIKRLGESSQEIGNIIEFITDISEQTNTLALNASIQAAMAGEAGRGFAVVAEEVQRLAERAANATRQIETLVKTIQADTNEAIVSMERSTANVVGGAQSAEEAGQALTRIEASSTELAKLIQDISGSARSQSAQATRIAGQMQAIRDIAVQTSGSAGQTAEAVGELSTLSEKLRESVSGFKLPNDAISAPTASLHGL